MHDKYQARQKAIESLTLYEFAKRKDGLEELFAEMQLILPWQAKDLQSWREEANCLDKYYKTEKIIKAIRMKICRV